MVHFEIEVLFLTYVKNKNGKIVAAKPSVDKYKQQLERSVGRPADEVNLWRNHCKWCLNYYSTLLWIVRTKTDAKAIKKKLSRYKKIRVRRYGIDHSDSMECPCNQ